MQKMLCIAIFPLLFRKFQKWKNHHFFSSKSENFMKNECNKILSINVSGKYLMFSRTSYDTWWKFDSSAIVFSKTFANANIIFLMCINCTIIKVNILIPN